MKRLVLLLSLVLLLALAACGLQPETQEVLPGEGTAAAGETPGETTGEATPLPATPDVGDVIGGTIIPTPVSYTHLDVYKRQDHDRPAEGLEGRPVRTGRVESLTFRSRRRSRRD